MAVDGGDGAWDGVPGIGITTGHVIRNRIRHVVGHLVCGGGWRHEGRDGSRGSGSSVGGCGSSSSSSDQPGGLSTAAETGSIIIIIMVMIKASGARSDMSIRRSARGSTWSSI